jgi:two-component system, chemotaxis family, chemotaxis protein CheY
LLEGQEQDDGMKRLRDGAPVLAVAEPAELRAALRGMLRAIGCSEIADCDGPHAMAQLRAQRFGLVIADLAGPEMTGLDLLGAIRADAALADLPVVLVTAAPTEQTVIAAKRLGVDGCLVRPFNLAMLTRHAALALRHAHPEPAPAAPGGGAAELRAGVAVLMRMIEHRLAAAELALDEDALQLLKSYLDRAGELGLGRRHMHAFEALCSALRGALRGELAPAAMPLRDAATAASGAVRFAAPRHELRRFRRFSAPALQIGMLGQPYRTLDWSASGLALAHYTGTLVSGRAVEASIRMEGGDPGAALFREPVLIVRNDTATGRLSARFQSSSWIGLKLMEQLIHRRIEEADGLAA